MLYIQEAIDAPIPAPRVIARKMLTIEQKVMYKRIISHVKQKNMDRFSLTSQVELERNSCAMRYMRKCGCLSKFSYQPRLLVLWCLICPIVEQCTQGSRYQLIMASVYLAM